LKHLDFKKTEATRPDFDPATPIKVVKSPNAVWRYGQGVNDNGASLLKKHIEIDPYAEGRPMMSNYKLLISGIVPRPIGFLSTKSADGRTENLSPMSYFQVVDHDPPMFVVGFSARAGRPKDTYRNLKDTGECVINVVSENMMPAVNATSLDAPYGVSEWTISGLHQAPSATVKPARVKESVFSIEGKLTDMKEFEHHAKRGRSLASLAVIEATRFWAREDAVNEDLSQIDLSVLRPVAQLGGISYGRVTETFELPRSTWKDAVKEEGWLGELPGAGKKES
jgi:flavin reductase (DIM6/NTAB) family NADH-FMN oxidoreductase RutF